METLLDTLPSGDGDDLLTIERAFERVGCQRQRLALYLGLTRYISSGPYLVPGRIVVRHNLVAFNLVGPAAECSVRPIIAESSQSLSIRNHRPE